MLVKYLITVQLILQQLCLLLNTCISNSYNIVNPPREMLLGIVKWFISCDYKIIFLFVDMQLI